MSNDSQSVVFRLCASIKSRHNFLRPSFHHNSLSSLVIETMVSSDEDEDFSAYGTIDKDIVNSKSIEDALAKKVSRNSKKPEGQAESVFRAEQITQYVSNETWDLKWLTEDKTGAMIHFLKKGKLMIDKAIKENDGADQLGNLAETRCALEDVFDNKEYLDVRYALQFTIAHVCKILLLAEHKNGIFSHIDHVDRLVMYIVGK